MAAKTLAWALALVPANDAAMRPRFGLDRGAEAVNDEDDETLASVIDGGCMSIDKVR